MRRILTPDRAASMKDKSHVVMTASFNAFLSTTDQYQNLAYFYFYTTFFLLKYDIKNGFLPNLEYALRINEKFLSKHIPDGKRFPVYYFFVT